MITPSANFFSNQQPITTEQLPHDRNKTLFLSPDDESSTNVDLPALDDYAPDCPDPSKESPDYTNDIYSKVEQWLEEDDEYTYLNAYNQIQIAPHQ